MKKFLVFLVVALLFGAGLGYFFWWRRANIDIWTFVPTTSMAVFQPNQLSDILQPDEHQKILRNLLQLPELNEASKSFGLLDSLTKSIQKEGFYQDLKMLISYHRKSGSSIAALYIIELNEAEQQAYFKKNLEYLSQEQKFTKSERSYQGFTINEFKKDKTELAYIYYRKFLIVSFSPFLVDDAIRMIDLDKGNFLTASESMRQVMNRQTVGKGRLYINYTKINKLGEIIIDPVDLNMNRLEWFAQLLYLDVNMTESQIDFTGFSLVDSSAYNYLSTFAEVGHASFDMKDVIPKETSLVIHASFDKADIWHNGLKRYWRKRNPSQLNRLAELESKYEFNYTELLDIVAGEVGLFVLDSKKSFEREKVFCIKQNDHIISQSLLNQLAVKAGTDSSYYIGQYANRRMGYINIGELPSRLFGELFNGFDESYYFVEQDYIFIGNSQHALEQVIDDMDHENTWRKSLSMSQLLASTNEDANLSFFANGNGFWTLLKEVLNDDWSKYVEDQGLTLRQIEHGLIQFTRADNQYYTNISLHHPGEMLKKREPANIEIQSEVTLDAKLISKPFAVKNHVDGSLEMMVQDSLFNLNLIGADNKVALKIPLKGRLTSKIEQLDYYKNGKLQYLFALEHSIHLVDRTGEYIPGYPVTILADQPITHMTLIDYDQSKEYRIMVATQKGFYYLYSKDGQLLDGWNPKKLSGEPAMGGTHLRVNNNDYMIFSQDNGTVHNLTRTGLSKPNFPLDLKENVMSPLYVEKGGNSSSTIFVAVTKNGDLIAFNLDGKVLRRDQFLKQDMGEEYQLVNSTDGKDCLVARMSDSEITFFNKNNEELFRQSLLSKNTDVQYYNFGTSSQVVVLVNREFGQTNLYDTQGNLLHARPLITSQNLAIIFQERQNTYQIYYVSGKKMIKAVIRR